jgi:hypothetical protein
MRTSFFRVVAQLVGESCPDSTLVTARVDAVDDDGDVLAGSGTEVTMQCTTAQATVSEKIDVAYMSPENCLDSVAPSSGRTLGEVRVEASTSGGGVAGTSLVETRPVKCKP